MSFAHRVSGRDRDNTGLLRVIMSLGGSRFAIDFG